MGALITSTSTFGIHSSTDGHARPADELTRGSHESQPNVELEQSITLRLDDDDDESQYASLAEARTQLRLEAEHQEFIGRPWETISPVELSSRA